MNYIGKKGEDIACEYLVNKNYEIIKRNYHSRYGEIDIIARYGNEIIFCEVKARSKKSDIKPCEYVDKRKIDKMIKTAKVYLADSFDDTLMRFDVIDIIYENNNAMIKHYENIL